MGNFSNSIILQHILLFPTWREDFARMSIRVKEEGDLVLLKYVPGCDFSSPIVCEARGIIIDVAGERVVCRGFDKFFNSIEPYAAEIDWTSAEVQEKVDGSIVKLYWYNGKWNFATDSSIYASGNVPGSFVGDTYAELIKKAINYQDIPFEKLDKGATYIFELVSPENRVVLKYDKTELIHLGTRDNASGIEREEDIGIAKPKKYPLSSMEEVLVAIERLNACRDDIEHEGFVVVDGKYNRIKVKTPEYLYWHRIIDGGAVSKKKLLPLILDDSEATEKLCKEFPHIAVYIRYYQFRLAELEANVKAFCGIVDRVYEEYGYDRRLIALKVKDHPLGGFGFEHLKHPEKDAKAMIRGLSWKAMDRLIQEYEPEKMSL